MLEAGRQVKEEQAGSEEQWRLRETEIRLLHRVMEEADKNSYESQS